MKFEVNIECNNSAFEDENINSEVARILNHLASMIQDGYTSSYLTDINGNSCGFASFKNDGIYNFYSDKL